MVYFESFCYVMYYIVLEIRIARHFLEDRFYFYSQQIKSAVANESLTPYNLIKRGPYFFLGRELLFIDFVQRSNKNILNLT